MVFVCLILLSTIFRSYHLYVWMLLGGQWSVLMICRMIMPHPPPRHLKYHSIQWHSILTWGRPVPKFYTVNHSAKWGVAAFACTIILLHLQAGCAVASSSPFIYLSVYVPLRKNNYIDPHNDLNNACNHLTMQKTLALYLNWVISP